MARKFNQILAEVTAKSDPQRKIILKQIADLPNQQLAGETSLNAQKDQAYVDIVDGARERGLGFAGIPLGEQAKYNATQFAPAVANLKSSFVNQGTTLQTALADYGKQDYMSARDIYSQDRAFAEQQRQFKKTMAFQREQLAQQARDNAAARSASAEAYVPSAGDYLGALLGGGGSAASKKKAAAIKAVMTQRKGGGFNFNIGGKAVSAATYAKATNQPFRSVLSTMAKKGDVGAKVALTFVGNDFRYDPRKATATKKRIYQSLAWGR